MEEPDELPLPELPLAEALRPGDAARVTPEELALPEAVATDALPEVEVEGEAEDWSSSGTPPRVPSAT